jgi:hypothetical protein
VQSGRVDYAASLEACSDSKYTISIASSEGYSISQQKGKLIEQVFGWAKFIGSIR